MSFRSRLSLLLCAVISAAPLLGAENDARVLTWDDAVKLARQTNPDLLSAEHSAQSRRASYKESYNGVLPRVSLSNSYVRSKGDTSDSPRWRASGSATMDIFNQSTFADISVSRWTYEQSRASLRSVASSVLLDLRTAFASLLYQQQLIDVSKTVLDIRRKNAQLVSLRYSSGRESKGNRMTAEAELIEAEIDLNQAQRDLKASQQEFKRRLGDETYDVVIATGNLSVNLSSATQPDFNAFVESNPQVALRAATLETADAAVRQARGVLWPNLSANYTRSFSGSTYFPDQPDWTASGVVSLPIFGSGLTSAYYSVTAAKRSREQAAEDLRSTRYQVRTDLETAWSSFNGAADQERLQQAFLEAARQRNEEADVRYSSGLMTYEDWEKIVTDRVGFERSVIRARRDAVIAEAQWNGARGVELGGELK